MRIRILAVGQKLPQWCALACDEYLTRLTRFLPCSTTAIPLSTRHKNASVSKLKETEGEKMLDKIDDRDWVVALDVKGAVFSTEQFSEKLNLWKQNTKQIVFLIGGPDGLSPACLKRANTTWSLSALTFPHPLVRVLLVEQLYRACSFNANHPYHRE